MNNFESTRPSDDRSQDFQSNPISSGSVQQRAVDPSFVNTTELRDNTQNFEKPSQRTPAHNILPGHDNSKSLASEQDSFVNIPGSFPGEHLSTQDQNLTDHHRTHQANPGVAPALRTVENTIGADIGTNNQYAKNTNDIGLHDRTGPTGRVDPDVLTSLKDTRDTIGADITRNNGKEGTGLYSGVTGSTVNPGESIGQGKLFSDSDRHIDSGLFDKHDTSFGDGKYHGQYGQHTNPGSLHTSASRDINSGNQDVSQLIHDIHRISLDPKSTQNTDNHQSTVPRADDDISTRTLHNAPMTTSPIGSGFSGQEDSSHHLNTFNTRTSDRPSEFEPQGRSTSGLGAGIDDKINEYKRDISNPAEHTNVKSELSGSAISGTHSGVAKDLSSHPSRDLSNDHRGAKPHYGEVATEEVLGHSFGNSPHNPNLRGNTLAGSSAITDVTGHAHSNKPIDTNLNQDGHQLTTDEVLTDSFGNPPHNTILEDMKLAESNEITDITGSKQHSDRNTSHVANRAVDNTFNPTNPQSAVPSTTPGVLNVAHSHDDELAPSLISSKVDPAQVDTQLASTGHSQSTYPQGGASTTGTTDHLNRDLHSTTSPISDVGVKDGSRASGTHDNLSSIRPTENAASSLPASTARSTENTTSSIPTSTTTNLSHNDNGLSDATNNTPIHRDESTNAETGTASALGSMIMGKIKEVAGSILGNEQMKEEGGAKHDEAKNDLHEARNMHSNE
ncbi:hypothetical protein K493DRAFT_340794 [Basidiobolus meristosporus CBS 931.73]|uniref:CsbD-like domain-containing protein n=1 Tax=Basidiobolus meristosporus CBS 931.73 TaxID=1314790 RepID=A0A1Y1XTX9_9FUNG|nr:hypothetical protein K493DRAFT_340794 [Basidiobolus meristosporus CBS 931.73]|eukprot:ORX89209.1 hypothetical protein K493DRAFT_340794 [Basidiobolus meristosporus CBS 931.73]